MEEQAKEFIKASGDAANFVYALIAQYTFSVIGAIILLIVGWIVAGILQRSVKVSMARLKNVDQTLAGFFGAVTRYAVLVIVIVMVLGQFGVQTASIVAALGGMALAIGLALQGTLQNIAAGIMLLVLRPFRVGEYIDTGSINGIVMEIGLFATELKTPDGMYRLAPNSTLWNVPITNFSRMPTRRFDLVVGIAYEDNIDTAITILMDLAEKHENVMTDPAPDCFVSNLGDSAVEITLRYWASSAVWWPTSREMTKNAKNAFDAAGISIPFPQMTLSTLKAEDKPAELMSPDGLQN
ncbi:mechanosensitive ion channel domain-containing protein [Martelella sp. HB161492]|uniref:mechanosensitive ion channel family protein n=1 Tax=Martelella sp. HB161492 TaxID=2720726 RepID=UPI001591356D|nr:mechanosensitive ion channel domain-containing protein [Martelella sp. HB161492]